MMGKMLHMGHGVEGTSTPPAQLDAESAATVAATLQALATPSRLRMLTRLRHGACSVGDLVEAVGMEQSAVSHQLRLLRAMGLVTGRGRAATSCTACTTIMWRCFSTKRSITSNISGSESPTTRSLPCKELTPYVANRRRSPSAARPTTR